jgi:type IV pilus assembly protein PilA
MQTMLKSVRDRRESEEGFTLIELMVVVLIIAILIAIAIPTFLGARQRANDRAAQSSLRNALTAAKTSFTDTSDYTASTGANLKVIEPSLNFASAAPSTDFKTVSVVAAPTGQSWWAAVLSKSGTCYGIEDNSGAGGGTTYQTGGIANCTAPVANPNWAQASW